MDTYVENKNAIEKEMNGDFSGYEDYIEVDRESLKTKWILKRCRNISRDGTEL